MILLNRQRKAFISLILMLFVSVFCALGDSAEPGDFLRLSEAADESIAYLTASYSNIMEDTCTPDMLDNAQPILLNQYVLPKISRSSSDTFQYSSADSIVSLAIHLQFILCAAVLLILCNILSAQMIHFIHSTDGKKRL